jgi:hypothetical protein
MGYPVVKLPYITASDRRSIDLYPCKVNPRYTEEVDPKKSNKSECRVYANQAVPAIPHIRKRCYSPMYKVTGTPSHGTSRITLALPGGNRETHLKSSSDKIPALAH